MIISHRLKFAFFRSPKTGSTTTELILRMSGLFDDDDILSPIPRYDLDGTKEAHPHVDPDEAFEKGWLTMEQAREYSMFSTLRDPFARAVSGFSHAFANMPILNQKEFAKATLEGRAFGLLEKPQVDYFYCQGEKVCEPVDFRNFQQSVKDFVKMIGRLPGAATPIEFPVIPNFNLTIGKQKEHNRANFVDANPEVKAKLSIKHAADIALYEAHYGKL